MRQCHGRVAQGKPARSAVTMTEHQPLTFEEFCRRMGWPYPLPLPGTPEADRWIDDQMGRRDGENMRPDGENA